MPAPRIDVPKGPEATAAKKNQVETAGKEVEKLQKTREYGETIAFLQQTIQKMPEDEQSVVLEKKEYKIGIHRTKEGGHAVLLRGERNPNNYLKVKYQPNGLVEVSEITLNKEGKKIEKGADNRQATNNAVKKVHEVLLG